MVTRKLNALPLQEVWNESGMRLRVDFPLTRESGTESCAVVYFEIEPDDHLARHTDSAEELLLVLEGEGIAVVGDERSPIGPGSLAVVPALVPHEVHATGDSTLKVIGFFAGAVIDHVFDEPLQPIGLAELRTPAPAGVAA